VNLYHACSETETHVIYVSSTNSTDMEPIWITFAYYNPKVLAY